MGETKSHPRLGTFLRGAPCVAALLLVGACDGSLDQDVGTQQVETKQGVLNVDFRGRGAVLTSRNDNSRTGANLLESDLKPSNVNMSSFGLRYTRNLDGKVYAQPLYVPGVWQIHFEGWKLHISRRDIVYVVSEHNTVYAFDANDATNGTPLWSRTLGPAVPAADVNVPGRSCLDITPEIGISQTPTIDLNSQTMYVIAKVEEGGVQNYRIHALDIRTGADTQAPTIMAGTYPGTASDAVNGVLTFNPVREHIRASLLLDGGILYVAAAAHCDFPPWHGWIFAYDAKTLQQKAVLVTTPDGAGGGVWQSGAGLSADASGVYAVAGNGTYEDGTVKPQSLYGQAVLKLKLNVNKLDILDWFVPFNVDTQNFEDADLASAALLIPETNLVVALTRGGRVPLKQMAEAYVLPRDNFGHFHAAQTDEVAKTVLLSDPDDTADPTNALVQRAYDLVYFKGPGGARLYSWAQNDFPRAFTVAAGAVTPTPVQTGTAKAVSSTVTGMLSISAQGTGNGILWGTINVDNADKNIAKTMLYAFDATTLQTLWNSRQNQARDEVGTWGKFAYPTIAGGKVFVANADSQLKVYGLLQ
jgi:hypothetical protein